MEENSYLNAESIKSQCDAAFIKLQKDNTAIYTVEKSVNAFIENEQISSTSFSNLKQQIKDYKTVLQAMRTANQSDMEDFLMLRLRVGNQELDGIVIRTQKEKALKQKKFDEDKANKYKEKACMEKTIGLKVYYTSKAASYRVMAEADQRLYNAWQEKEDRYNEIESCTNGLFSDGAAMRAAAENALNSIKGAFKNGRYVPDMQAPWRTEISNCYISQIMKVNADGSITANWREVERILGRNPELITEEEYNVLAMLYLNLEEEDLAQFLQLCMDKTEDVEYPWWWGAGGLITDGDIKVDNKDYSVWEVNEDKMQNILDRLINASDDRLFMMQMVKNGADTNSYRTLKNQRNIIIQRTSLMEAMMNISEYRGEYQAEYPRIIIELNNAEDIILEFCESRSTNELYTGTSNLGESTITVTRTKNGTSIDWGESENMEISTVGHFEDFSGYRVTEATEYMVDQIPNEMIGNVIGYVPIIGNVLSFVEDNVVGYVEEVNNASFISGQIEINEKRNIYSDFDCSANFVSYDTASGQEEVIYVQEGENTVDILKRVNEKMNLIGTENVLTIEQVITEPNEVRSIIDELIKKNPNYADRYDEAIQAK